MKKKKNLFDISLDGTVDAGYSAKNIVYRGAIEKGVAWRNPRGGRRGGEAGLYRA